VGYNPESPKSMLEQLKNDNVGAIDLTEAAKKTGRAIKWTAGKGWKYGGRQATVYGGGTILGLLWGTLKYGGKALWTIIKNKGKVNYKIMRDLWNDDHAGSK
jgi:hypothetical protein